MVKSLACVALRRRLPIDLSSLEQGERTHDIGLCKGERILDRTVYVALSCEVDDTVHMLLAQETAEAFIVTDIHLDKPVVGLILYILEIGKIARVCKFIQIDDEIVRILIDKETHYVTPDKARTARDDDDALVGLTVGHDV